MAEEVPPLSPMSTESNICTRSYFLNLPPLPDTATCNLFASSDGDDDMEDSVLEDSNPFTKRCSEQEFEKTGRRHLELQSLEYDDCSQAIFGINTSEMYELDVPPKDPFPQPPAAADPYVYTFPLPEGSLGSVISKSKRKRQEEKLLEDEYLIESLQEDREKLGIPQHIEPQIDNNDLEIDFVNGMDKQIASENNYCPMKSKSNDYEISFYFDKGDCKRIAREHDYCFATDTPSTLTIRDSNGAVVAEGIDREVGSGAAGIIIRDHKGAILAEGINIKMPQMTDAVRARAIFAIGKTILKSMQDSGGKWESQYVRGYMRRN